MPCSIWHQAPGMALRAPQGRQQPGAGEGNKAIPGRRALFGPTSVVDENNA